MDTAEIHNTHNLNIESISPLPSPEEMKRQLPLTREAWQTISEGRRVIPKILRGEDLRMLAIVGPCSVHSVEETLEYCDKLKNLALELKEKLFIVVRLCCDKPRSRVESGGRTAWQGLFNDYHLNGSCDLAAGYEAARKVMLGAATRGIPVATEYLEKATFQVIDDLPSYVWIGARDVNSQEKKKVASGLSCSVGFKNPPEGSLKTAIHSIEFAASRQVFSAPDDNGLISRFQTKGNRLGHLILRGTSKGPNYDEASINDAVKELQSLGLVTRVIVDVAHDNSQKDHMKQAVILDKILTQIKTGNKSIAGFMYESYLQDGNQKIPVNLRSLRPGVSITDPCDGWERTERTLRSFAENYQAS